VSAANGRVSASVRLHGLRLQNFRGVRSLALDLGGRSAALIGPNGSGKSSVADAVDFVLTGQVRRLTGEGAQALSLAKHGRHVDAKAEESWVEADLHVGGARHRIRRAVARPDDLEIDGPLPDAVRRALGLADGGHHLLTRREVLRYIFTEPSSRGQQVAALLRLTRIDTLRKEVQGAAKEARAANDRQLAVRAGAERALLRCVDPAAPDRDGVLAGVNRARARLAAPALEALGAGGPLREVAAPGAAASHPLAVPRAAGFAADVVAWADRGAAAFAGDAAAYLDDVEALRRDPSAVKALRAADLLERGLALVPGEDDAGGAGEGAGEGAAEGADAPPANAPSACARGTRPRCGPCWRPAPPRRPTRARASPRSGRGGRRSSGWPTPPGRRRGRWPRRWRGTARRRRWPRTRRRTPPRRPAARSRRTSPARRACCSRSRSARRPTGPPRAPTPWRPAGRRACARRWARRPMRPRPSRRCPRRSAPGTC
jgi:hypothetical protein